MKILLLNSKWDNITLSKVNSIIKKWLSKSLDSSSTLRTILYMPNDFVTNFTSSIKTRDNTYFTYKLIL